MSARFGVLPKVVTLVPLAALSAVCTANVAQLAPTGVTVASPARTPAPAAGATPEPSPAPEPALAAPEQTTGGAAQPASPALSSGVRGSVVAASAASSDIPAVALAAYQRAATVIDTADPSCHLDWTLLAAVGRVESDHGRTGGGALGADGVATPAVVGPVLNGRGGRMRIADTDGGSYDGDTRFDHAVGPLQLLPSTWSVISVDADGDGRRDPQDVDDASLAAAVYLCSGTDDLATAAGQRAALLRYNHSASYVSTVLAVAGAYGSSEGFFGAVPAGYVVARSVDPTVIDPAVVADASDPTAPAASGHRKHRHATVAATAAATAASEPATAHPAQPPAGAATDHPTDATPSTDPTPTTGTPAPAGDGPTQQPASGPGDGSSDQPTGQPSEQPTGQPGDQPSQQPSTPAPSADEVTAACTDEVDQKYPDTTDEARHKAVAACVDAEDAPGVVAGLGDTVDGLEPAPSPTPEGQPAGG